MLAYAVECANDGDGAALAALGVSPAEGEELRALPPEAIDRAAVLCVRAISCRFAEGSLERAFESLRTSGKTATIERDLILAGASRQMMRTLFGTTPREFTTQRRALGLTSGRGRPRALDEASEHALYHAASRLANERGEITPELYLELHRETNLALRVIWRHVPRPAEQRPTHPVQRSRSISAQPRPCGCATAVPRRTTNPRAGGRS